jgi:hypothetical protein
LGAGVGFSSGSIKQNEKPAAGGGPEINA